MYVAPQGPQLLPRLLDELINNSANEVLAVRAARIAVTLHRDGGVTVADDGGGIAHEAVPAIFGNAVWPEAPPQHPVVPTLGVGVIVVSALARRLEVVSTRHGRTKRFLFERGVPLGPGVDWSRWHRGTTVTFVPDEEVVPSASGLDSVALCRRLRELTYLCPSLVVVYRDLRGRPLYEEFRAEQGLAEFASARIEAPLLQRPALGRSTLSLSGDRLVEARVALQWDRQGEPRDLAYVNLSPLTAGGTYQHGLRRALKGGLPALTRRRFGDACRGLTTIVSVRHPAPRLKGTSRVSLENAEVRDLVAAATATALDDLRERPHDVEALTEWAGRRR